jgi:hypothetical protein
MVSIEEFHLGFWERLGYAPAAALFKSWEEADRFIDRLREIYPLRQYRIVRVGKQESAA